VSDLLRQLNAAPRGGLWADLGRSVRKSRAVLNDERDQVERTLAALQLKAVEGDDVARDAERTHRAESGRGRVCADHPDLVHPGIEPYDRQMTAETRRDRHIRDVPDG